MRWGWAKSCKGASACPTGNLLSLPPMQIASRSASPARSPAVQEFWFSTGAITAVWTKLSSLLENGVSKARRGNVGPPVDPSVTTKVVEFNDVAALEKALQGGDVACVPVLYRFPGPSGDGEYPYAGLVRDAKSNLYGTTFAGGDYGYGTVFKLTP